MNGGRALAALALLAASSGAFAAEPLPVAGVDALRDVAAVESPAQALPRWVGLRGATLLHVGTPDGLLPQGDREPASRANYVRAASGLGIVREAVWVAPFLLPGAEEDVDRFRAYLRASGLPEADAGSFVREGRCFRGRLGALPLLACGQEGLPELGGPVLLSIDANYLPLAADTRGRSLLSAVRDLLTALAERRYPVRDAVVSYAVEEGSLPIGIRWVGDAAVALLRDPAPLGSGSPPEPWAGLQRVARQLAAGERHVEFPVVDALLKLHDEHQENPALHYLMALTYLGLGGEDRALETAEDACRIDPGYCFGLEEIGIQLLERKRPDAAELFFAAAARLRPGMRYALLDKALGLARFGRDAASLAVLVQLIERDGPLPGSLLAGVLLAGNGDRAGARRRFDEALAELAAVPEFTVTRPEVGVAAAFAARFYREEGLPGSAERLERDPRLRSQPGGEGSAAP